MVRKNIWIAKKQKETIEILLFFFVSGDIDTLNEKYSAEIYYEAKWKDKIDLQLLKDQVESHSSKEEGKKIFKQIQLINEKSPVRIDGIEKFLPWSPQLFIENAIGQVGEQDKWFTFKKISNESLTPFTNISICEHRWIKGVFWEKLELNHVRLFSYSEDTY